MRHDDHGQVAKVVAGFAKLALNNDLAVVTTDGASCGLAEELGEGCVRLSRWSVLTGARDATLCGLTRISVLCERRTPTLSWQS